MPRDTVHRAPVRAPIAFLLIPLLAGHGLSAHARPDPALPLAGAAVLATLSLCSLRCGPRWAPCFLLAAMCTFWADGILRRPAPPSGQAAELPVREVQLELKIERVFSSSVQSDSIGGIARVRSAVPRGRIPPGSRICFRIRPDGPGSSLRGSTLEAQGLLEMVPPRGPDAEGFSFHDYLRSTGVFFLLERGRITGAIRPAAPWTRFFIGLERRFVHILSLGEPPDPGPGTVYRAMLLGNKGALDDARRANYRDTGTLHLFAISGLHIAVVAGVLGLILQVLRLPAPLRPLIALPVLYAYVQAVGAPPSAVRAFLMAVFFWLGTSLRRQRSPVAALAGSATFVLLLQPSQLGNPGFLLSYAVVLGILLLGLPLNALLTDRLAPFRDVPDRELRWWEARLAGAAGAATLLTCVGLSAWLASTPLCAAYFGVIAPSGMVLNLLLVHLASLVITTGVLSLLLGSAGFEAGASFVNQAAWMVIRLMDTLVDATTRLPGSTLYHTLHPGWAYAALATFFGLLMAAHTRSPDRRSTWLLCAPAALLVLLALGLAAG